MMGDFRASIKIEMSFMGVKDKIDLFINYFPEECCNMDKRVVDFFNSVYERGIEKYNRKNEEYEKRQKEIFERSELKRLKEKYEKI